MQSDQRSREIEALQERLSRLSETSLRINESPAFDTVLQGCSTAPAPSRTPATAW